MPYVPSQRQSQLEEGDVSVSEMARPLQMDSNPVVGGKRVNRSRVVLDAFDKAVLGARGLVRKVSHGTGDVLRHRSNRQFGDVQIDHTFKDMLAFEDKALFLSGVHILRMATECGLADAPLPMLRKFVDLIRADMRCEGE